MKRHVLRAAVGCATLIAGVLAGSIHQHLVQKRLMANVAQSTPTAAPSPQPAEAVGTDEANDVKSYPENTGIGPGDIEYFINRYPHADLEPLWRRLNVRNESGSFGWGCTECKAQSFSYNLDDDPYDEVVLRIGDDVIESYRYLVFKERAHKDAPLLGYIDAWAKYRPSMHVVVLSGGKAWLVVESQSASGTGLAAYHHTIYQVTTRRVKPVITYFSEISQYGEFLPSRHVVARPLSIEIRGRNVKATISYTVEYSYDLGDNDLSLFTKNQTAVLIGSGRHGATRLDTAQSNITAHEFETVFNFDSLFEGEFLNYNHSELRAIAVGRDAAKKKWLKDFLDTCENSGTKRELLALLR